MQNPPIALTFDDAVENHSSLVAPLLLKLGFGATFFICEFPLAHEEERQAYLSWEQIVGLHRAGFEIGNHTINHCCMNASTPDVEIERVIDELDQKFAHYGIPKPTTYAYPGGPYCAQAVPALKKRGYQLARTAIQASWNRSKNDPFIVPAFFVHGSDNTAFLNAVKPRNDDTVVVLIYHGVPDILHGHVNTPPANFIFQMQYLKDNGYRVASMRDLYAEVCPPLD